MTGSTVEDAAADECQWTPTGKKRGNFNAVLPGFAGTVCSGYFSAILR